MPRAAVNRNGAIRIRRAPGKDRARQLAAAPPLNEIATLVLDAHVVPHQRRIEI